MSSLPHKVLQHKLSMLRQTLEQRQQQRRTQRLEDIKKSNTETQALLIKPTQSETMMFLAHILATIKRDEQRLQIPATNAEGQVAAPPAPMSAYNLPTSPLLAPLVETYLSTEPLVPLPHAEAQANFPNTPSAHVLALMQSELELLIETNTQLGNIPGPLLAKLKQAIAAYGEGRTSDTVTVLKNALTGDPHNQTLLMCLSQVLYAQAAKGTATALPEARDYAQRSTIANQKQRPARLPLYQYLAVVTERAFSEERAIEWLRDTDLLAIAPMQTSKGLFVNYGIPLRAWGILATISPNLWHESEFRALRLLVTHVVGGAALYLCWLREPLIQAAAISKTPLPELEGIDKLLQSAALAHSVIVTGLTKINTTPTSAPWILRWRWLQTLMQTCGTPALETVLLHIALDGQNWRENIYPDKELQVLLDDPTMNTWRVWAQSMTPFKDVRKAYLIPHDELAIDADVFKDIESMLGLLKSAEQERVRGAIWNEIKPWLVRWQMEHFLAATTGSNQPRTRFAPTLAPFSTFYRRWQEPQFSGLLASEVIAETARRGGFANWFEVMAAFDGALRLMDDPNNGLQATQKRAFAAAQKKNPAKFAGKAVDFGRPAGNGMGMAILPLGFVGALFAIFTMAANTSQAIGLSLALFGLAGVVMLNLSSKK